MDVQLLTYIIDWAIDSELESRRDRRLGWCVSTATAAPPPWHRLWEPHVGTTPPWHRLWEKTWHHYRDVRRGPERQSRPRNVTFYVDGVAEDTWKATVNTSLGSPLYIGADVQGPKR